MASRVDTSHAPDDWQSWILEWQFAMLVCDAGLRAGRETFGKKGSDDTFGAQDTFELLHRGTTREEREEAPGTSHSRNL